MDDNKLSLQSVRKKFSTEELLGLLACFEGEIQARDIVIATLKVKFLSFFGFHNCSYFLNI